MGSLLPWRYTNNQIYNGLREKVGLEIFKALKSNIQKGFNPSRPSKQRREVETMEEMSKF